VFCFLRLYLRSIAPGGRHKLGLYMAIAALRHLCLAQNETRALYVTPQLEFGDVAAVEQAYKVL
jgi:hypothetical protein